MTAPNKKNQLLVVAICSVGGGVVGYVAGLFWATPGILIPIGVVVGIAVGLAVSTRRKNA